MAASPPDNLRYRHQAIADEMLANPMANQNQIAEKLGYTPSWISTVINSDAFQAYYRERRAEWDSELASKAHTRALEVGLKALDKTEDALEAGEIDPVTVFDKALQRAGMAPSKGSDTQNNTQINNNYYTATSDELRQARERMTSQAPNAPTPALENDNGESGG